MSLRKSILFSILAALLFFGGLEGILRLHDFSWYVNFNADLLGLPLLDLTRMRRVANRTVTFDRRVFWRFKPDQVLADPELYRRPARINHLGFRGPEFTPEKPAGTFRILCLGDSTTFGWSVADDETYPAQLEKLLQKQVPGRNFQALNLGVTGYTSLQGRELFRSAAAGFQPDLVIFAFGPNDRLPALMSDAEHLAAGDWQTSPLQVCLSRLQLYKLLRAGVVYLERRRQGLSLDPKTFLPRLKRKVNQREFLENAAAVKHGADALGASFILVAVDFPSLPKDHVFGNLREEAEKAGAALPPAWTFWDSEEVAAQISDSVHAPLLDLRGLLAEALQQARAAGEKLPDPDWQYLMIDNGHPNARGHRLIAERLASLVAATPAFHRFAGAAP
jgi:lysophospholipase L1-like esterase